MKCAVFSFPLPPRGTPSCARVSDLDRHPELAIDAPPAFSRRRAPRTLALIALTIGVGAACAGVADRSVERGRGSEPRARELSRALCAAPRLAGTDGSRRGALWVAAQLERAGFTVTLDERLVLLSLPRRLEFRCVDGDAVRIERVESFDPDATPAGDVPTFNAWSASGRVEAGVVTVGRGLRADYEALREQGVDVAGRIALATYGGAYRGVKAEMAEEHGCVGLLLYNDPTEDGPDRGPTWPSGPWKPGWAAQRGAISSLVVAPGDPSTPGWASTPDAGRRLDSESLAARLPRIPVLPIGADDAAIVLGAGDDARVLLDLSVPRELRRIVNVIARLPGTGPGFVVAGNHRDAWVRGAHDAGSGTVSLLRAAERLGARFAAGWRPANGIVLGFWDAEEFGLIGSTEWGEAHEAELVEHAIAYVNADAAVGGTRFHASGTPGLMGSLRTALERVPAPAEPDGERGPANLWEQWTRDGTTERALGLPGSGSDFTVFLHHVGLPVLDVSFGGNAGGQYHTRFDDFELMDRFLDPTWEGHEAAGHLLAELLGLFAERGRAAFDPADAARGMARMARAKNRPAALDDEQAERIARAFDALATVAANHPSNALFYRELFADGGLRARPWYRNQLWAPGVETGYAAETLPALRAAAAGQEFERELDALIATVDRFAARLAAGPESSLGSDEGL